MCALKVYLYVMVVVVVVVMVVVIVGNRRGKIQRVTGCCLQVSVVAKKKELRQPFADRAELLEDGPELWVAPTRQIGEPLCNVSCRFRQTVQAMLCAVVVVVIAAVEW